MSEEKECPYCNSRLLISKKGNPYCPNICWEKPEVKLQSELDAVVFESKHGDWGDRQ